MLALNATGGVLTTDLGIQGPALYPLGHSCLEHLEEYNKLKKVCRKNVELSHFDSWRVKYVGQEGRWVY